MGTHTRSIGFTIIEVMLFLAVSGALAVGVLATSSVGINNQRYQDAVNSFKATVQEEFINTTRVKNSRQGASACPLDITDIAVPGATNCVVMGRLMTISATGAITRSNLVGKSDGSMPVGDIAGIKSYHPTIDTAAQETGQMNWGTTLRKAGTPQALSIVVFRSPQTGNVLAFVKYGEAIATQATLATFMATPSFTNNSSQLICIDPSGWTVGQMQGIVIDPYAAGPGGVEQRVVQEAECA